jgi:lipoyl(octanoyl) transferase
MSVFAALEVYHDGSSRTAAMNMAIDEALFENATKPSIRLYQWNHRALSFGYFGRYADVADKDRDLVRRWTGGGIVFHGNDLTYSVVIPETDPIFKESSLSIYEKIHQALCDAFVAQGQQAVVAAVAERGASRTGISGVTEAGYSLHCFANPVRADVVLDGRKVAGAAQRRTKGGLLQQGSIQNVELVRDFEKDFAAQLSDNCTERKIDDRIFGRAQEIAERKYGTEAWLRKR